MKASIVMVLTGLIILFLVNLSIWNKQDHIQEGEVIYLELAPVDPRSLMQGDYMALRYVISTKLQKVLTGQKLSTKDGFVVIEKDINQVAQFVRFDNGQSITDTQRKLQFRLRNKQVKFATNAFFFEEGDEPVYRNARYGVFRINKKGEVLLTGLLGEQYNLLGRN
jgi:uncharacterized membrane-anchored protein